MKSIKKNQFGFGAVEVLLVLVIVAIIGAVGWYVWHSRNSGTSAASTTTATTPVATTTKPKTVDPYAGWKTATSPRAKFTIKYPSNWTYSEQLGDKDGVEHITIDSSHFHITIDSFIGNHGGTDATGATANATCVDCTATNSSKSFTVSGLGKVNLDNVIYTLDSGKGNALILRLADGTYGLLSPKATNIYTNFRGISVKDSLQAYQAETPAQFVANPDYTTAQNILKSLTY